MADTQTAQSQSKQTSPTVAAASTPTNQNLLTNSLENQTSTIDPSRQQQVQQPQTSTTPAPTRNEERPTRKSSTNAQSTNKIQTQMPAPTLTSNTGGTNTTQSQSQSKRSAKEGSVIGSMTTWVPPTANITQSKAIFGQNNENKSPPPQSVAIVAGRKYIMVPKTNMMSISPSGVDTANGVHNFNETQNL